MKPQYLIVDTAGLVKHVPLWEYGETLCSVPEVITEIRDKEARRRLEALPFPISMRQPQPHSIKFVNEFSKKTGDYASLSLADMKVLALTYELEVEVQGGAGHLNTEPHKILTEGAASKTRLGQDHLSDRPQQEEEEGKKEAYEEEDDKRETEKEEEEEEKKEAKEEEAEDKHELGGDTETDPNASPADHTDPREVEESCETLETEECEENRIDVGNEEEDERKDEENSDDDDDDDDDGGGGWITCENIKKHKGKRNIFGAVEREVEDNKDVKVACITGDFAMQNVLKHIGLAVMGVDGHLIKQLKTYILRCHACYRTTSVMDKIFCPHCGNKTLKKVSVTLDPDGTQRIWINTKRPINKKGTKYSLPTPKGGKHGRNPILVADQREANKFSSKMSRKKVNPLHEDYNPDQTPFAVRDVYSRAAQLGYIGGKNHHHFYWEKRNPNEPMKRTGKK